MALHNVSNMRAIRPLRMPRAVLSMWHAGVVVLLLRAPSGFRARLQAAQDGRLRLS